MCLSPQCDGTDLTAKVQEMKLQCLLFLNIPRYKEPREMQPQSSFLMFSSCFCAVKENSSSFGAVILKLFLCLKTELNAGSVQVVKLKVVGLGLSSVFPAGTVQEPCHGVIPASIRTLSLSVMTTAASRSSASP